MALRGKIESLWRYPVKSMAGEEIDDAFLGFAGVYGDRVFAFTSSAKGAAFPYLTAREQKEMVRYQPRFRNPELASRPTNLAAAEQHGPGVTPLYAGLDDLMVDVALPSGDVMAIDDPRLERALVGGIDGDHGLSLIRSARSITDCRPVSLFSLQTAQAIGDETESEIDKRRFRSNLYIDFETSTGFVEDQLVGRSVRIGPKAVVAVVERDPRCKMITLDPDSLESDPNIMRTVAQEHEGMAGVYGAVLVEGTVRRGDRVEILS